MSEACEWTDVEKASEEYVEATGIPNSGGYLHEAFEAGAKWAFKRSMTPYGYVFGGCTFLQYASPLVTDYVRNNSLEVFLKPSLVDCDCTPHNPEGERG